jgi:hypothetical protein
VHQLGTGGTLQQLLQRRHAVAERHQLTKRHHGHGGIFQRQRVAGMAALVQAVQPQHVAMDREAEHLLVAFDVDLHRLEAAGADAIHMLEGLPRVQQGVSGRHAAHREHDLVGLAAGQRPLPRPAQHVGGAAARDCADRALQGG